MQLTIKYTLTSLAFLLFITCQSQIKNTKTISENIKGNCGMCKTTIEKAGNLKKVAEVNWDQKSKTATISFDSLQTNKDEILKRIALSGYDNDAYLAPDEVYAALPGCCQYERDHSDATMKHENHSTEMKHENHSNNMAHQSHKMEQSSNENTTSKSETHELNTVFETYFSLKDALVLSDANSASIAASNLVKAIENVKMEKLEHKEHMVWMKILKEINSDVKSISNSKDLETQRKHFSSLSTNFYDLAKASDMQYPIHYQNCPMYNGGKGANWLSKENPIKNPYYGSKMMSCGSTVETIQ